MVRLALQQPAVLPQHFDDVRIGVEHLLPGEQRRRGQKAAIPADRVFDLQVVTATHDIVIQTVPRCRVHRARAGIERDVIAQDHRHFAIIKRMLEFEIFERLALRLGNDGPLGDPQRVHDGFDEFIGQQQPLTTFAQVEFHQRVIELRMHGDRTIRRQRPRRRGPNGKRGRHVFEQCALLGKCHCEALREIDAIDSLRSARRRWER